MTPSDLGHNLSTWWPIPATDMWAALWQWSKWMYYTTITGKVLHSKPYNIISKMCSNYIHLNNSFCNQMFLVSVYIILFGSTSLLHVYVVIYGWKCLRLCFFNPFIYSRVVYSPTMHHIIRFDNNHYVFGASRFCENHWVNSSEKQPFFRLLEKAFFQLLQEGL